MKLIFVLLTCYLNLFHISEPRKCRVSVDDQVLPYEIDRKIMPVTGQFSLDDLILEQVDDDTVMLGGRVKCIKSMDPKLPIQMVLKTLIFERATWRDGPIQLFVADVCKEIVNPNRFWYNMTKLFTPCPAKVGDIWPIDQQIVDVQIDLSPSMPFGTWKVFGLFKQGIPGMEKTKFGFGFKFEFVPIN